jgi:hypothetical protein
MYLLRGHRRHFIDGETSSYLYLGLNFILQRGFMGEFVFGTLQT